ncbi:helix-turn-helix transcriptional regulator [Caminibacter pacificus]|uniref:DNA-binding transcriptional regulator YafY n=1 Tax=Caminibacter pacificus TaxID=1424653 RepID=A0AAJ4RES0_9BACT|nr:WYL domain-containing protein [Caminibacter pacificus]QCI28044.1 WYL domain-containing protein [Caminibacter pacificus]ROR41249.1 putative DNA-binding transcriptional regulator YafY [Caminibacter pacificus]
MRTKDTLRNLLKILNILYSGGYVTIKGLIEEYGIKDRTASRYLNEYLPDAGFSIEKVGRKFRLANKNPEITGAIEAIENFAKEAGFYNDIKDFIKTIKQNSLSTYMKLHIENIGDYIENVNLIENAIKQKRMIKFTYDNGYEYEVKPLKIANFEGYWYLLALDEDKYKTFHLKSIKNLKFLKKSFEISPTFLEKLDNAINVWFEPNKEPFKVVLKADEWASKYLKRIPLNPTQKEIEKLPDGSIFEIKITHEMEIKRFVKSFLPQIKVIEPKWLDDKIKEEIKEYLYK